MLKAEIIRDVSKYLEINSLAFCSDIIAKLNYYPDTIGEIVDDPYLLEAVRIHIEISNKWKISYTDRKYDNYPYRTIHITKNQNINIVNQINALNNDSLDNIYDIKDEMYDNTTTMTRYFIFHSESIESCIAQGNKTYGIVNIALGISIFDFLKYQRLDILDEYIDEKYGNHKKSISDLYEYYRKNKSTNFFMRDRIICMDGMIKTILGLSHSGKSDLGMILRTENEDYVKNIVKYFMNGENKIKIVSENGELYNTLSVMNEVKVIPIEKNKRWIMQEYPNIIGAKNIYDIFANPLFHFHFMGIKFISLDGYIKKLISRASCNSFVDLVAMKNIINVNFDGLCMPYFNTINGTYTIHNNDSKRDMYKCIMNKYIKIYSHSITIKNIKKIIPMCSENIYNIYSSGTSHETLKKHHKEIKRLYIEKYCKDIDVLIDVGTGKMNDFEFWGMSNIRKVYVIEPNEMYIEEAMKKINKKYGTEIIFNNTRGDIEWEKINIDEIANCITLTFTMQYMFQNLGIMINNFKNFSQAGTYIVMFLMDGNKIHENFKKSEGKDIAYYKDNEPYFVVHPFYELSEKIPSDGEILVYMKDIRTINRGNIEKIVDVRKIIDEMVRNNFELVENKHLGDIKTKYYDDLEEITVDVSNFFSVVVFRKI